MPKYAEEILAAVTELQQHPTAEQVFLAPVLPDERAGRRAG